MLFYFAQIKIHAETDLNPSHGQVLYKGHGLDK